MSRSFPPTAAAAQPLEPRARHADLGGAFDSSGMTAPQPRKLPAALVTRDLPPLWHARGELFDPLGIDSQPAFQGRITDVDKPEVVKRTRSDGALRRGGANPGSW